jgi:hypothetical protein
VKVFLDFNGAPPMRWGTYNVPATPAYDRDGDATTFSQGELDGIRDVWARVSEKYSPFNVNVTTVDPGTYEYSETVRIIVGGDSAWGGGEYGGYGYVSGFVGLTSNTAFVFSKNLAKGAPGLPQYVAEAAAHEAGHNFGLQHQSQFGPGGLKTDEYNRGDAFKAPIMGFSYYAQRGLWWNGTSLSSTTIQDDLSIISGAGNGFGYRADDFGGTAGEATPLTVSGAGGVEIDPMGGVIERVNDSDWFTFTSPGGNLNVRADVAAQGPMLNLALRLLDVNGNVLALADTLTLGEQIMLDVPAGQYYLAVSGHGDYGDIGQYRISGSLVPEPGGVVMSMGVGGFLLMRRRKTQG